MKKQEVQKTDNFLSFLFFVFGIVVVATLVADYYVTELQDQLNNEKAMYNSMVSKYLEIRKLKTDNPYIDKIKHQSGYISDIVKSYFSKEMEAVQIGVKPPRPESKTWEELSLTMSFDDNKNPIPKAALFNFLQQLYINSPFIKLKKLDIYFEEDNVTKFSTDLSQYRRIPNNK